MAYPQTAGAAGIGEPPKLSTDEITESRRRWQHARDCFDRRGDFDAVGCLAQMVAQPKLGLWTQWRVGPGPGNSAYPAALGSALKAVGRLGFHLALENCTVAALKVMAQVILSCA